ncbi:glycosyltransferase family 61 protein [Gluconobacter japonicus]|uniref:glycosyltransferase family 61 protein n=1 Tax=Gluconobacter japonicus TaxID=376620 RepID=UPI000785E2D4|nr:glycosyltransferase family 61 protein [Gluconobacter japonicus]KXV21350.1 hypothetical protein AD935_07965 [Gluconobacter japonicus]
MLIDCHTHNISDPGAGLPPPVIHIQKDAVYYPRDDKFGAQPWGIYDLWGRLVPTAALDSDRNHLAHGQTRLVTNQRTACDLPEIECAVYGGMLGLHYGHTLLEFLPRLWYLRGKLGPSAKILIHCGLGLKVAWNTSWFRDMMHLIGITEHDLISPRETILVRNLLIPEASFQINGFCSKTFADFTQWMGDRIPTQVDIEDSPYFLTKKELQSGVINFTNENELCSHLEDLNFRIVSTENLSFTEQISLFKSKSGTCGMLGSNIHTSIFSKHSYGTVFNIGPAISKSFELLDAVTGANFHYVTSPDLHEVVAQPGFRRSFELHDPAGLARDLYEDFHTRKTERETGTNHIVPHGIENLRSDIPREFQMVRSQLGKLLCIRTADSALMTTYDIDEEESAYPAIVTQGTDADELWIFALSPRPILIRFNAETPKCPFLSCKLTTTHDDKEGIMYALQDQKTNKWLTFAPDASFAADFCAPRIAGWEHVKFEKLSEEQTLIAANYYQILLAKKEMLIASSRQSL